MRPLLHKLLILCCALSLSGVHWVVLQTAAWTGMLVSRSVTSSVTEALETTFDGQHPCPMCTAIADGRQTEQQTEQSFDLLKKVGDLKFVELFFGEMVPHREATTFVWPVFSTGGSARSEAPPTPPPLA